MPEPTSTLPMLRDLVLGEVVTDRDAAARSGSGFVRALLTDAATRMLELRGDRAAVLVSTPQQTTLEQTVAGEPGGSADGAESGARVARLLWRSPTPDDVSFYEAGGVVLYLGRGASAAGSAGDDDALGEAAPGPGTRVVALLRPPEETAQEPAWRTLREVGLDLDAGERATFTTAVAMAHWHAAHPRCPRCGDATAPREAGWMRRCPADGSHHFPRTDPAVIMAVVDRRNEERGEDKILLARGNRWGGNHRSVLAGFVEPGESFEAAVARETFEESGVVVDEVTYLGNQPWPFPASVMIGFVATARTRRLTAQEGEIEEIGWYSRADVRRGLAQGTLRLPGRLSIARSLIEHWYGGPLPDGAERAG